MCFEIPCGLWKSMYEDAVQPPSLLTCASTSEPQSPASPTPSGPLLSFTSTHLSPTHAILHITSSILDGPMSPVDLDPTPG